MERISKHEVNMEVALAVSKRSPDEETKVGAVLVKNEDGAIVATGYNGFARGVDDSKLPKTRDEGKYDFMIHAEQNLIAFCAKHAISMDNCTLYCTLSPCFRCMRLMWQCGIKKIICKDLYRDFDKTLNMEDLKITMHTLDCGLHELTYEIR